MPLPGSKSTEGAAQSASNTSGAQKPPPGTAQFGKYLERDETTDAILYLTANDDILYLLAMELRATRKRIGFVLNDTFRRSLLETRTLTNSSNSEVVLLRDFLIGSQS